MQYNTNDKSAFIAIVGRPNVGKSSILNRLLGQKIAIVSSKPQTTRNRITGVMTDGEYQIVFFDTPGMHKPKNTLGKYMVRSVNESVGGVDCCMLVVEAGKEPAPADLSLIEKFKSIGMPAILAINKIDMLREKDELMKQILTYSRRPRAVISSTTTLSPTSPSELSPPSLSARRSCASATRRSRTAPRF